MLSDTIAAIATPAGRSAIALVRISGRAAHEIAGRVLSPFNVDPPRSARRARARHPATEQHVDDVLYLAYRAPASYTGEDAVEISTHGGLLAPAEVLGALLAGGARLAAPGEFTRRAVMNGKMDLLQAEAVADLVDATAPAQRRAALLQLDRGLSQRISQLRERVLELEALISYDIDFPEEDSGPIPPARVDAAIASLDESLGALLGTAGEGERLREGALAVIAGRPNAGKSSLFNALLGHERAIVTEIPGTTRDAIEAPAECGGFPFRLVDTAGLRESDDRVERLGIEVSRRYLAAADVVVFCVEAARRIDPEELAFITAQVAPVVVARTKGEAGEAREAGERIEIVTSAHTGRGIPELRDALARVAFAGMADRGDVEPVITRARHRAALDRARSEVRAFADARASGLEGAVAATHLRGAVTALEDVIGVISSDEVLGKLFATFCVGK